jgi:hypothetical protein
MDLSTTPELSQRDIDLILRAGAHALAVENTPALTRFRNGVTDEDAARLIHQIERGARIVMATSGRSWHAVPRRATRAPLTRIVDECLRLGLVYVQSEPTGPSTRRLSLAASITHYRRAPGKTLCSMSSTAPYFRYRLLDDIGLVDCQACGLLHR